MTRKIQEKPATIPLGDHLCLGVYAAHLAIQRCYKPVLDHLGITYAQYLVLALLWENDRQAVGELAQMLDLEPSTISPLLKRLESKGFIRRERNPESERQVLVSLTEIGRGMKSRAGCIGAALQDSSGYSTADILSLNADIRRFREALLQTFNNH